MRKVALFIPAMNGGGAERVFVRLANYLSSDENIEVHLILNRSFGPNIKLISSSVIIHELKAYNIFTSFWKLSIVLKKYHIDYLMSTVRGANVATAFSRIMYSDYRWVLREANTFTNFSHRNTFSQQLLNYLCKHTYKFSDHIIANSPDTSNDIIHLLDGIKKEAVTTLPNPVLEKKVNKPRFRRYQGIKRIIAIGRLEYQKDYFLMLQAIEQLTKVRRDFVLDIYGDGSLLHDLQQYCSKNGLTNYVNFQGYSECIEDELLSSDLFLLTSHWEGFGNVLVESLSTGTPIVSVECPGGPRFILEKHDLIKLTSRDPQDLSNQIDYLLSSNPCQSQTNSLRDLSCKYLAEVVCKKYAEVLFSAK
ncbi:glycosyltransferase [Vibrio diabolicus]|uniref:glycosyltransferase n=1 Tax=Vibrio diabolicus TaxID=50719 RepID=UPI002150D530|nr:glycosyltransferase [Vibrio diabolicus]MCE3221733.1 glycosyltransferase [Vibrio diabolicus]